MFFKWLLALFFWAVIAVPMLYSLLFGLPKIPSQVHEKSRNKSQLLSTVFSFSIFGGKNEGDSLLTISGNGNDGDDDDKPYPPRFPFFYFESLGFISALSAVEEEIRRYANSLCPLIRYSKEYMDNNIEIGEVEFSGRDNKVEKVCFFLILKVFKFAFTCTCETWDTNKLELGKIIAKCVFTCSTK